MPSNTVRCEPAFFPRDYVPYDPPYPEVVEYESSPKQPYLAGMKFDGRPVLNRNQSPFSREAQIASSIGILSGLGCLFVGLCSAFCRLIKFLGKAVFWLFLFESLSNS